MSQQIEELILDDDVELEEAERLNYHKYSVPLVTVGDRTMYFNAGARDFVPPLIKWYVTSEYAIAVPTTIDDPNAYRSKTTNYTCMASIPFLLKQKKLKKGIRKIMKYKNGFAFKRYEQFDPNKE